VQQFLQPKPATSKHIETPGNAQRKDKPFTCIYRYQTARRTSRSELSQGHKGYLPQANHATEARSCCAPKGSSRTPFLQLCRLMPGPGTCGTARQGWLGLLPLRHLWPQGALGLCRGTHLCCNLPWRDTTLCFWTPIPRCLISLRSLQLHQKWRQRHSVTV